jgi:predicted lipoprotein with Yx(FWY)xxD motif
MNRGNVMFARAAFTGLFALTAAACGAGGGYGGSGSTDYGTGQSATLMVATDARLGDHLVDGSGRSLYYFAKDVPGGGTQAAVSNCDAACLAIWPIFGADTVDAQGINAADVGQITGTNGRTQATYKGFPLYYYAGDTAAGDTRGEGLFGLWHVVHDPNYSITQLSKANETSTYLTDGAGRALYVFARDTVGTSSTAPVTACTSACMATWSTFLTDQVTVPSDLAAADFTVYTRADGTRQSAYKGHPLYRYVGDAAPGETNGRGIPGWQTIDPATL